MTVEPVISGQEVSKIKIIKFLSGGVATFYCFTLKLSKQKFMWLTTALVKNNVRPCDIGLAWQNTEGVNPINQ